MFEYERQFLWKHYFVAQEEKVLKSPEKSRRGRTIKPNSRFSDANFEYDFKDKIDSESDLEDILKGNS